MFFAYLCLRDAPKTNENQCFSDAPSTLDPVWLLYLLGPWASLDLFGFLYLVPDLVPGHNDGPWSVLEQMARRRHPNSPTTPPAMSTSPATLPSPGHPWCSWLLRGSKSNATQWFSYYSSATRMLQNVTKIDGFPILLPPDKLQKATKSMVLDTPGS